MSVFVQTVILLILLAVVTMLLLSIKRLIDYKQFDDKEETEHLKKEVQSDYKVISSENIFKNIVNVKDDSNV